MQAQNAMPSISVMFCFDWLVTRTKKAATYIQTPNLTPMPRLVKMTARPLRNQIPLGNQEVCIYIIVMERRLSRGAES